MSRTPENTENRQAPAEETADLFAFLRPMAEAEIDAISRLPELPLRESAALGRELLLDLPGVCAHAAQEGRKERAEVC